MEPINFKRIAHDTNGNPRYVCHFLNFINETDRHCTEGWGIKQTSVLYDIAVKRANKIGGKKYNNKQYGGGIVFQMYEGQQLEMSRKIQEIANQ